MAAIAGLDELKRVNPLAQIPTLVLDGSVLSQSAAILIHLGLAHPESHLIASEPSRRAQQIRGLVYIAANCYAAIGILDFPERWAADPDDALRASMKARGARGSRALGDVRRSVSGDAVALGGLSAPSTCSGDGVEVGGHAGGARRCAPGIRRAAGAHRCRAARRCGLDAHWPTA